MAAAWGTFLVIGGVIGGTLGYGAYYRSDRYRRQVESDLTGFFGLPTQVGAIGPHSFNARELTDVEIWLPGRRDRVFRSPRVVWGRGAGGADGTVLDVHEAVLRIGSEEWEKEDYMRVLRASLQHNFEDLDVEQVRFHNARFDWPREDYRLVGEGVAGTIVFDERGRGQAELSADALNGTKAAEPIRISARLDPEAEDFLPEVTLTVPPLPLAVLGLDEMLRSKVTRGSFAGQVTLRQLPGPDEVELSGRAEDLHLEELTRRLAGGPVSARLGIEIEEAVLRGRQLKRIAFRGELRELDVDALAARMGWPEVGGTARMTVKEARITESGVERLELAGEWTGGSLDAIARAVLGRSGLHGPVRATVNSLVVENNAPIRGDIDIDGSPQAGRVGRVDLSLLTGLMEDHFGVTLPGFLVALSPESIEYVQLGVKLLVDSDRIHVRSVDGPAGSAMITLKTKGNGFPLLGDRSVSFPMAPILLRVKAKVDRVRREWERRLVRPPAAMPSADPGE